jgi:hypothetical protein
MKLWNERYEEYQIENKYDAITVLRYIVIQFWVQWQQRFVPEAQMQQQEALYKCTVYVRTPEKTRFMLWGGEVRMNTMSMF